MGLSLTHLLLLLFIVLIVFGAGRLPKVMGDIGKGVRSLREGLKAEDEKPEAPKHIAHTIDQASAPAQKQPDRDSQ